MTIKPNKWKVILSLIPVYALLFLIPLLPTLMGKYEYNEDYISSVGLFFENLAWFFYVIFVIIGFPFSWLLQAFGLVGEYDTLPEINPFGLVLLALIYSTILYLLISLLQWKKRG